MKTRLSNERPIPHSDPRGRGRSPGNIVPVVYPSAPQPFLTRTPDLPPGGARDLLVDANLWLLQARTVTRVNFGLPLSQADYSLDPPPDATIRPTLDYKLLDGATVGDRDLGQLSGPELDRWRGGHVGYVPQRLHLIASLSVLDNLLLAPYLAGTTIDRPAAEALLVRVGVGELAARLPETLSQGQAQRVAIARAVINRPLLLLADEPTAALDDAHAAQAISLLTDQADAVGATLVVASHDARIRAAFPHTYALPAGD